MNIWVPEREVTQEETDMLTTTKVVIPDVADRRPEVCGVPYRRVAILGPVLMDEEAAKWLGSHPSA